MSDATITITLTVPASALRAVLEAAGVTVAAPPPAAAPSTPLPAAPAAPPGPVGEYVDTTTAAAILGLTPRALEAWRLRGQGPAFTRLGRAVRYRAEDVRAFASGSAR